MKAKMSVGAAWCAQMSVGDVWEFNGHTPEKRFYRICQGQGKGIDRARGGLIRNWWISPDGKVSVGRWSDCGREYHETQDQFGLFPTDRQHIVSFEEVQAMWCKAKKDSREP